MLNNKKLFDYYNIEKNLFEIMHKCFRIVIDKGDRKGTTKKDGTLVTQTDKDVDNAIKFFLENTYEDIPIISEEGYFKNEEFNQNLYWLVDPIDGTSSFIKGKDEYTINIALIEDGVPILGIIGHPPSNTLWFGYKNIAFKIKKNRKIELKTKPSRLKPVIIISGRYDYETQIFIEKLKYSKLKKYSSSIKFCKIAEGQGDLYPRLSSIKKWDIAAGDAILRMSGGMLLNSKNESYNYCSSTSSTGQFFAVSSERIWKKKLSSLIK